MARLVIVVETSEVDPTRVDPHDIAEELLELHEAEHRVGNRGYDLAFVSAEWES